MSLAPLRAARELDTCAPPCASEWTSSCTYREQLIKIGYMHAHPTSTNSIARAAHTDVTAALRAVCAAGGQSPGIYYVTPVSVQQRSKHAIRSGACACSILGFTWTSAVRVAAQYKAVPCESQVRGSTHVVAQSPRAPEPQTGPEA